METTGKSVEQVTEGDQDKSRKEDDCLLEAAITSEDQATGKIDDKPFQDGDCVLEEKVKDQQDNEEEVDTDEEDEEITDEEDDMEIRSTPSSSAPSFASYQVESDEESEDPGKLPPCNANEPNCLYLECQIHKDLCDICNTHCLDPDDSEQRRLHRSACKKDAFFQRQFAIAAQQSFDKRCCICFEIVKDKRPREQRFGILPNCEHVFCLRCIRNWRKVETLPSTVRRGCPVCRVVSYFVCPSFVWVKNKKAKHKLISQYKSACKLIPCKYVQQDAGVCPFRRFCFYQHAPGI
ncbi:E3 ubiquitin-protein ligase makorin-2-like [Anopheles maculipalpis]|uniref:E3 ubiquitin-protein ligase makorin-2-like n=1 Tax=Anopheles maculipalpis TaxID=1496333 RepID=UPI002159958B|nr:E3 ubiquitin-protein ligase makorin-2-like [Anopheles maculipalpis]